MVVCQRVVCWRVRTSRARSRIVALPGSVRRRVRLRQFLRSLKPCSTGARAADRAWLAWRWAGVVLRIRVDLQPVMMTGSSGSGSRPVKPRSARAPSPASPSRAAMWSWRAAVIVAQRGEHDEGDLAGRQLAPPGADLLQVGAQQAGDEGERLARQPQRALAGKRGALGGLDGCSHKRLTCIGGVSQEGFRGVPNSAPCPLIAAGFCERGGVGQGARSARRAAPKAPLTRTGRERDHAGGRGREPPWLGAECGCGGVGLGASPGKQVGMSARRGRRGSASLTWVRGALAGVPAT